MYVVNNEDLSFLISFLCSTFLIWKLLTIGRSGKSFVSFIFYFKKALMFYRGLIFGQDVNFIPFPKSQKDNFKIRRYRFKSLVTGLI